MVFLIRELCTAQIDGDLVDQAGVPIVSDFLDSLTVTIYDVVTGQVINSRNHQSILNENGGTVDAQGHLIFVMSPADNAIVNPELTKERHRVLFEWVWTGTKKGNAELDLKVTNVGKIPT